MALFAKHQGANFDRTDAAFEIQLHGKRHAGKLLDRNVRQERARIEIDGVTARRLHDRHAFAGDVIAQVRGRSDAIAQIIFFQRLLQADGDGLQVAAGQSAVRRIALGQNQQILFLLGEHVVIGAKKAADIGHAVFLGRHGAAVAQENISCAISCGVLSA